MWRVSRVQRAMGGYLASVTLSIPEGITEIRSRFDRHPLKPNDVCLVDLPATTIDPTALNFPDFCACVSGFRHWVTGWSRLRLTL
jgi:hypothetical protein